MIDVSRPYSQQDDDLLREKHPSTSNTELARLLGRSVDSVTRRAKHLKLGYKLRSNGQRRIGPCEAGTTRLVNGKLMIKPDVGPWLYYGRWLWMRERGAIHGRMYVVHRSGHMPVKAEDFFIEDLELIDGDELVRRCSLEYRYPTPELREIARMQQGLRVAIGKAEKRNKEKAK